MMQFIDVTGKTENDAIAAALSQLGLERDEVSVEILERAKSGFLGIGASPAKVRVSYDDGKKEEPVKPVSAPKAAPKAAPEAVSKVAPKAEKTPDPVLFCPEVLQKKEVRNEDAEMEEKRSERPARQNRRDRQNRAERAPRAERFAPEKKAAPEPVSKPAEPVDRGEECRDEKAEQIRTFLTGLLAQMGSAAEAKVYEAEKGRYKVYLEGESLGALIGRRGETLDAIQQLTNYAVNHSGSARVRVQVDAENYREKREESLERLANKVAAKVVKYRRNVTLEPMNAYERHVIHSALQDAKNVTTFSVGTEPNRRVIVSYDRTKQ